MSLLNNWRILFCSFLLAVLSPITISYGCGGGDYDYEDSHYSFYLDEAFFPDNPFKSLNYSSWSFTDDQERDRTALNIEDWKNFFGNDWHLDSIKKIIYYSTIDDLKLANDQLSMRLHSTSNTQLVHAVHRRNRADFINYLIFAKECEPEVDYTSVSSGWYAETRNRDYSNMQRLAQMGLMSFHATKNKFLKSRYAYQIIRLAHYSGNYKKCISDFNSLWKEADNSLMYFWSLSLKAGAEYELGLNPEASYDFSLVFASKTGRIIQAKRGINIHDQEAWDETFALCNTDEERSNLWFIQSIGANERSLPGMIQIDSLSSHEAKLLHLFGRDIIRMESNLTFNTYSYLNIEYSKEYYDEVLEFVENYISRNRSKLSYDAQWNFGVGYLHFLKNDYPKAKKSFTALVEQLKNDSSLISNRIKDQMASVQIIMKYRYAKWSSALEEEVIQDLRTLEVTKNTNGNANAYNFLYELTVNARSNAHGANMKAILNNEYYQMHTNPFKYDLDGIINLMLKDGKTNFEDFFVSKFYYQLGDLYYLKGTSLMIEGQIDSAYKYLQLSDQHLQKGYYSGYIRADITINKIKSCNDCDNSEFTGPEKNLVQVIEDIQALKSKLEKEKTANLKAGFATTLGNIYYNLTAFGNAWYLLDHSFKGRYITDENKSDMANMAYGDCSIAAKYYNLALILTKDKEERAHLIFQLAMCEQNEFYVEEQIGGNHWLIDESLEMKNENYRSNFKTLIKEYSNTKFYARALEECGYLGTFAQGQ